MYKLIRKEKSFKYSVLASENTLEDIIHYLIYYGYLDKFDFSKEYIQSVLNGNTCDIKEYLRETILNFGINDQREGINDLINNVLTEQASIYMSDTGDTCIILDSQIEDLNNFLSIYGIMLIEEIEEVKND